MAPAPEAGFLRCAQTVGRAGKQGEDGAPVVTAKVDGTVEVFGAEGANDGEVLAEARLARDAPDACDGGVMLQ